MSKIATFIIATAGSIVGVVANAKNIDLGTNIAVKKAADLEGLSLVQMTAIYNNATGKTVNKFSVSKAVAAEKTMAALEAMDMTKLVQLDAAETAKVEKKSKEIVVPGERKERDSKLQRMKRAFMEQDDAGSFKLYTIKELMEKCGTTEKITHQYISILRAASDRFVMNIVKDKDAKTFQYQPKPVRGAKPAAAAQQASA
jgi:pyruvate/2-oxoacid:ferredoxin oxidoreductase beta subunit